ncbi:MAG: hypothetical protein WD638_00695 [Nitriliruptoraceae bacterium]
MTSAPRGSLATPTLALTRPGRGHLVALLLVGIALVLGMYTGLARGGIEHRFVAADLHAVLMVFGFLGTLFALHRALEVDGGWAYLAPASSAAAVLALPFVRPVGDVLLVTAGGVLVATYLPGGGARRPAADLLGLLGALAWLVAAAHWLLGSGPVAITPLTAVFLVLTLLRMQARRDESRGRRLVLGGTVLAPATVLAAGAVMVPAWRASGLVLAGLGLVALAVGSAPAARQRLAGTRDREERFASRCAALATGWLAASGLLWIATGAGVSGVLLHDAVVHSLFLGSVLTQVMGLTPGFLRVLLGLPVVFARSAQFPVVLLQSSVLVRIGADLVGSPSWREIALHGNVTALLLFLVLTGLGVRRAARAARRPAIAPEIA